jgi:hypothetical protein
LCGFIIWIRFERLSVKFWIWIWKVPHFLLQEEKSVKNLLNKKSMKNGHSVKYEVTACTSSLFLRCTISVQKLVIGIVDGHAPARYLYETVPLRPETDRPRPVLSEDASLCCPPVTALTASISPNVSHV